MTAPPLGTYSNEQIITPIFLKNSGDVVLREISLSTDVKGIELSKTYFDELRLGQEEQLDLIISDPSKLETKEITVWADVKNPSFRDNVKIYLDALARNVTLGVRERIVFAYDLFKENPECLELQELLDQAQISLDKSEYEKARSLVESAINGCRDLMSAAVKPTFLSRLAGVRKEIFLAVVVIAITLSAAMYFIGKYSRRGPSAGKVAKYQPEKKRISLHLFKRKKTVRKISPKEEKIRELWKR